MIGRATPLEDVIERDWQHQVVSLARMLGWLIFHTYDSRRSQPGLPDLVLVRDRVVWAELKREKGKLTGEQEQWRDRLEAAGAEWYCWRPSDLDEVGRVLARRERGVA